MNGEEFRSSYKLLRSVSEEGVQTYHALNPNGRSVMVHLLAGGTSEENRRLLALVDRLGPADRRRVIDTLEVDGSPVLVTEVIHDFKTLERRISASGSGTWMP